MKVLVLMYFFVVLATLTTGCLIRTNSRGNGGYQSCPPAHHWDGYACVHNGRGGGPKVRDHRR